MNFVISSLHKYKDKCVGKIVLMSGEGETKLNLSICDRFQFEIAAVFFK
jgi:hypothetical protein